MIATRVNKNSNFLPLYLAISTLVSWVLGATVIIGWLNPPFYWSTSHLSAKLLVVQSQVSIVKSLYNFSLSNSDAPWSNPIFHGEITTPDGEIAISLMAKSMLPMIIPYVSHFSSHIIATFPGFPYPFFSTCQMRFVRFYVSWSSAFSSPALSWAPPVQRRHESSVAYQKKEKQNLLFVKTKEISSKAWGLISRICALPWEAQTESASQIASFCVLIEKSSFP